MKKCERVPSWNVHARTAADVRKKAAWTFQEALNYLQSQSGKHFDPVCVRAFELRIDAVAAIMRELGDKPD